MNLKHVLRQIEADGRDSLEFADSLAHGRLSFEMAIRQRPSWHADAVRGAVHPITVMPLGYLAGLPFLKRRARSGEQQSHPARRSGRLATEIGTPCTITAGRSGAWRTRSTRRAGRHRAESLGPCAGWVRDAGRLDREGALGRRGQLPRITTLLTRLLILTEPPQQLIIDKRE